MGRAKPNHCFFTFNISKSNKGIEQQKTECKNSRIIAILISIIKSNAKSVAMIANIISLEMSFLCGVFVEQSLHGESVLKVSRFLPAYWYIKANDILMFSTETSFNKGEFYSCIGIQGLFIVMLFAVIFLVSKIKHSAR